MYQVFLNKLALPVAPSQINIEVGGRNEVVELIDGSQLPILKAPSLANISFDILLPYQKYPFVSDLATLSAMLDDAINIAKRALWGGLAYVVSGGNASFAWGYANKDNQVVDSGLSITSGALSLVGDSSASYAGVSYKLLTYLELLKKSREPLTLVILRTTGGGKFGSHVSPWSTIMDVTLEDYTVNEDADAHGFDAMVNVNFKEYKKATTLLVDSYGRSYRTRA